VPQSIYARICRAAPVSLISLLAACADGPLPTQPSPVVVFAAKSVALEGESGSGDGLVRDRSRASGGRTVHLGPGERRQWTFTLPVAAPFALSVTYANGQEGPNEVLSFSVDGTMVSSFQNRDSGDAVEGWNLFVTDSAGKSTLGPGAHSVVLEVQGGDGCVEIDLITLSPA